MHNIWCPFDTAESNFVKILKEEGFNVIHGHISTGEDFFEYKNPPDNIDCIVSNPPFSKRDAIFERLYEFDIPFAMVMNFNGLFDSKKRYDIFKRNDIQMFVPQGRMKFIAKDKGQLNSPNFQGIYIFGRPPLRGWAALLRPAADDRRRGSDRLRLSLWVMLRG